MKTICALLSGLIIMLGCINPSYGQSVGKAGNRAVGVVFKSDREAFGKGEASVNIFRRDDVSDFTGADGVFCIAIPSNAKVFQLVYYAAGYWGQKTKEPISNASDPIKVDKVLLRQKNGKDKSQLENIGSLLETELAIYQSTTSPMRRKAMREELIKLSESIEIPLPDPTNTIAQNERELRIYARVSIDNVILKMK